MKLLLHIGTHKTASTSLQHFCALYRKLLQRYGFHYPKNSDSAYVFNFLASRLAFGKEGEVSAYLEKVREEAEKKGCHTVLISAESFYAMTGFFLDAQDKKRPLSDYWKNEEDLIEKLRNCCNGYTEISVTCYLRPQDDFASSLYNQFVKNVFGISEDYESFVRKNENLFDYDRHLALWERVFGKSHMSVLAFEAHKKNIIKDFCDRFLSPGLYEQAGQQDFESNVRLCRDVLEFKRSYNKIPKDRSLAFISARCFHLMARDYRDGPGYQIFASLASRQKFFSRFEEGNRALCVRHALAQMETISSRNEPAYSGLSPEEEYAIRDRLQSLLSCPLNRFELFLRRSMNRLMDSLPGGKFFLVPLRNLYHQSRLLIARW